MKNIFTIAAIFIIAPASIFAQSNIEEVEYFQSIFGMEKKAIVAKFIKLDGPAKDAFWTIYDQYEVERKALGQKRLVLLNDYVKYYDKLDAEKVDEIITATIKQKSSSDKLVNKYYKQIKKASGAKAAGQFFQIENYFLSVIRLDILENIPLIGELEMN